MKNLVLLSTLILSYLRIEAFAQISPNAGKIIYTYSDFQNALKVASEVKSLDIFLGSQGRDSLIKLNDLNLSSFTQLTTVNYNGRNEPKSDSLFEKLLFDQIAKNKTIRDLSIGDEAVMNYNFSELDHIKDLSIHFSQCSNPQIKTFDSLEKLLIGETPWSQEHQLLSYDAPIFKFKTITEIDIFYARAIPIEALSQFENLKIINITYRETDTISMLESWSNLKNLEVISCQAAFLEIPTSLYTNPTLKVISTVTKSVPKLDDIWKHKNAMHLSVLLLDASRKEQRKLNQLHREFLKSTEKICHDYFEKGHTFQLEYGKECIDW